MNYTPEQTANINIRISKLLKEQSSEVLNTIGITQSQFIRDSLLYVVNNHSLPWQNTQGSLALQYSSWQHMLYDVVTAVTNGNSIHSNVIGNLCCKIDELQFQASRISEEQYERGNLSIPLNRTNNLLTQLNSILKYQHIGNGYHYSYSAQASFQLRHIADNLTATINTNNL